MRTLATFDTLTTETLSTETMTRNARDLYEKYLKEDFPKEEELYFQFYIGQKPGRYITEFFKRTFPCQIKDVVPPIDITGW